MKVYKIKNKNTGLYFSQLNNSHIGFTKCKWNNTGKMWYSIDDIKKILKSHKYYRKEEYNYFFSDCLVVQCEILELCKIKIDYDDIKI